MAKEQWEINTESNLYEFLQHKRYVIVIDDLWNSSAWGGLKTGIPTHTKNGSRILLTSRHNDADKYVGGKGSIYKLKPLNEADSRNLFFEIINGSVNGESEHLSPSLMKIAETILEKCNGVPLAIVLTSGILLLRERVDYEWMGVLESMGRKEDECSQIFELSYKDLPSKLKPCFLYLGLFPEDYKIRVSTLIRLWQAERFIQGSEIREAEDVGEEYLNQLVVRNLVQVSERKFNGRIKTCHVHDILHSLCVRVAKEINFFTNKEDLDTNSMSVTKVRRLANHDHKSSVSLGHKTPKLRSMFLFHPRSYGEFRGKEFKEFIRDLEYMRVLCVGNKYITSFSRTIGKLIHLTYIQFIGSQITIPSAIKNLSNLMTLDVRGSTIIPSCIWEMKCLRHLLLDSYTTIEYPFYKSAYKFDVCSESLRTLQTLSPPNKSLHLENRLPNLRKLGVNWEIKNLDNVKKLIEGAPKLQVLKLGQHFQNLWKGTIDIACMNLRGYENLWKLSIGGRINDTTLDNLLPINITKLIFRCTRLKEDPIEVLKKLPRLKFLHFGYESYMGSKMCVSANFPHLQVLQFYGEPLRELVIKEPAMPQLKNLSFGTHHELVTVDAPQRIQDKIKRNVRFKYYK